jgi:hypothetical protein
MHRLVEVSFADLDIGDYFSIEKGRPRDIPVYRKTEEYRYKLVRGGPETWYSTVPHICFTVLRRMPPHKHNHL